MRAVETRRNLEIKARIDNLAKVRRCAQQLTTEPPLHLKQTDTYFFCRSGRLKLRETVGRPAQLIWYDRPEVQEMRTSRYLIAEIADADATRDLLSAACGVRAVVKKRRELYWYRYVRIHLDQVETLGDFLELEAVLQPDIDELDAQRLLADLRERFEVQSHMLISGSYVDML